MAKALSVLAFPAPLRWPRPTRWPSSCTAAADEYPDARHLLITLDAVPPQVAPPAPLQWEPAAGWLLDDPR